jgi:hypothetical protein
MSVNLGADVLNDLEIFLSYGHTVEGTLWEQLSRTVLTKGGKALLHDIVEHPTLDISTLLDRQTIISHLQDKVQDERVKALRSEAERNYPHVLWAHQTNDDKTIDAYGSVFFKYYVFKAIGANDRNSMLTLLNVYNIILSPAMTMLSPLIYFLMPYLVLVRKLGVKFSFMEFVDVLWRSMMIIMRSGRTAAGVQLGSLALSLAMYAQGVLTSLHFATDAAKVTRLLHSKMDGILRYVRASSELLRVCWGADALVHDIPTNPFSFDFGARLVLFQKIRSRPILSDFEKQVDPLFAYLGVADFLLQKSSNKVLYKKDSTKAFLKIDRMFHPTMSGRSVKNNVRLTSTKDMLITGPNAGGKSTYVKAIASNVMLGQTLGYACADRMEFTPFALLNTCIHIPDTKGVESLFQAEMNRCGSNLQAVKHLAAHQHALLLFDEIFNSTNVIEGIAGAYAILDALSKFPNCINIITTHYPYLSKLPGYACYRMNAVLDSEGNVDHFPYVLTRGVSKQYIALEMLRAGFDPQIVEHAIEIKTTLLAKAVSEDAKKI